MTALRTGVYICHCGTNIAGTVDVAAVRDWAQEALAEKGVVIARDCLMCSSLGQELDRQGHRGARPGAHRGGRLLAAHAQKTFRTASANAGLNPCLPELVSIREQVSWVHTDKARATEKAKAIIAGGVYRVQEQVPLEPLVAPVTRPRSSWVAASPASRPPWSSLMPATRSTSWSASRRSAGTWPSTTRRSRRSTARPAS